MRVVLVTTWYPTARSPVSGIFVQKDATMLASAHDVRVVHLVSPELLSDADLRADAQAAVPVTRIPMATNRPWAFARAWRALQPHLEGADVLHTHAFSTLLPF